MSPPTSLATPPRPPLLAGRYTYVRELGRGALGRVILVADSAAAGAPRAAKLVAPAEGERLRWEFGALRRIAHPAVASVHELTRLEAPLAEPFRLPSGTWVLIEELIEGQRSDEAFGARRSEALAIRVAADVARGLSAVHAAGLVHGDVKPHNVMVPADPALGHARLIDLGLASAPGRFERVSGTPAYFAPEAWLGERSAQTDLYALGVTMIGWLGGVEPDARSDDSVDALERTRRADPSATIPASVSAGLRGLLRELLARDPALRPESARALVRRLEALVGPSDDEGLSPEALLDGESLEERARRAASLPMVGLVAPRAELAALLRAPGVVVVQGARGSGRTRLISEAARDLQEERLEAGQPIPTFVTSARALSASGARLDRDAIVLDQDGDVSPEQARAWVEAAAIAGRDLSVVLEREEPEIDFDGVALTPLGDDELGELASRLTGARRSQALTRAAREVCGGLPGLLVRAVCAALDGGADVRDASSLRAVDTDSAATSSSVPPLARRLASLAALVGGTLDASVALCIHSEEELTRASAILLSSGLAARDAQGALRLRQDVARQIPLARELTPKTLKALDALPLPPLARACVDAARGRSEAARSGFLRAAQEARRAGDPHAAQRITALGRERLAEGSVALRAAQADALRALGAEERALALLSEPLSDAERAAKAELQRLLGDTDGALATLAALPASADPDLDPDSLASAIATRSRISLGRGDCEAALDALREAPAPSTEVAARLDECEALARAARGELPAALECVARGVRRRPGAAARARLEVVRGGILLQQGEFEAARRAYENASSLAERAGERRLAAGAHVNGGLARLDAGLLGPAIDALREGARALCSIGPRRATELGRALFNLGNAAWLAGDDALAQSSASRARAAAASAADDAADAHALIVLADVDARAGRAQASLAKLRLASESAVPAAASAARARIAVAHARAGDAAAARAELARCDVSAEREVAAARVALLLGDPLLARTRARGALDTATRFEERIGALLVSADAEDACGDRERAMGHLGAARALLERAGAGLSSAGQARLRAVDAYRRALLAPSPDAGAPSDTELRAAERALLAHTRRLLASTGPAEVMRTLVRAALETSGAERAFLIARRRDGSLAVERALGLAGPLGPEHQPSRSIAGRVLDERRPLLSVDAPGDERLSEVASVHALALRSVLAVPVRTQADEAMALYVDDRVRASAFGDDALERLGALADIGAAALASAERLRAERRAARKLLRRERALSRTLAERQEELRSLRGGAFAGIVAQSDAMRAVMSAVARVAVSEAPVLLLGESGTGKEVLARAIHAGSTRAGESFVAENLGAIPDGLAESALFGHVRGAFTGADQARRGLFELANEGTLFLDEVAAAPAALQAKLLRVLEDNTVRPVGGTRARPVSARIVAAASPDLRERARSGEFREDLFYRLAVVIIEVPPLRERQEDIAPLINAFLSRHAGGRRVRIDAAALAALRAYPWPGNVRELENEVRRALVVVDEVIRAEDLSPTLRGEVPSEAASLDLRAQVDTLERKLVARALALHQGNQTRAAKALGLSRFGLAKMIKRLDSA